MAKRVCILALLLVAVVWLLPAEGYTVIFKNGKTMTGTLVSETADTIVFKDAQGLQFSLKKSSLDLEKMNAANAPAPPPAPKRAEPAPQTSVSPKKPAKVYTSRDIDTMREKYGNIASNASDLSGDILAAGGAATPDQYADFMRKAGDRVQDLAKALSDMADGLRIAYQVNSSTGKNAAESLKMFREKNDQTLKQIDAGIDDLSSVRDSLQKPPQGMEDAAKNLSRAIDSLNAVSGMVTSYDGTSTTFDSRVKEEIGNAQDSAQYLLSVQAPGGSQQPTEEPSDSGTDDTTENAT